MPDKNHYDEQGRRHGYWEVYLCNLYYIHGFIRGYRKEFSLGCETKKEFYYAR